ncbi:MAG: helix-turn-helix domain-containing protein, partial [Candidatus Falkowbacteria bacterium]|nr:helix-turn-helix domain-containing protein [Candidatus Falkowbacteria bacterium]
DFYNLNFYENKKIPFEILELPKEFGISVVRAFADDEGSVDLNRRICFSSINKNLLEMLIKILKEKLDYKNISDIGIKDDSYFYFYIKTGDIEKYQKEINFLHPDKIKRLNEMIHIRKEGYKPGQHGGVEKTTKNILDLLNNKILSTYDIIKVLKINKSNVNIPVKRLINHGLIVQHHKEGQIVFWTRNK